MTSTGLSDCGTAAISVLAAMRCCLAMRLPSRRPGDGGDGGDRGVATATGRRWRRDGSGDDHWRVAGEEAAVSGAGSEPRPQTGVSAPSPSALRPGSAPSLMAFPCHRRRTRGQFRRVTGHRAEEPPPVSAAVVSPICAVSSCRGGCVGGSAGEGGRERGHGGLIKG